MRSWFPPPPDHEEDVSATTKPIGIDTSLSKNSGMKAHFHRLGPPEHSFEDAIMGEVNEEFGVDHDDSEEEDTATYR